MGEYLGKMKTPKQQHLDEIEACIEQLRRKWKEALTDKDKALIERRARCLFLAKASIQRYQRTTVRPGLFETAKTIFSGSGDLPAKTSSAVSEYDSGLGEGTSE